MMIYRRVDVALEERAFVHINEVPVRYLGPGRHRVMHWPWRKLAVLRFKVDGLVSNLRPELAAMVPAAELATVRIAEHERGVVVHRGKARLWLGPGVHYVWTVELAAGVPTVEVRLIDTTAVAAEPLVPTVRALAPATDYTEVAVPAGAVALRYVDGALDAVLEPGRHAAWTTIRAVSLAIIDLRERMLSVNAQEVMTRDHVTLRLNLAAAFRVVDPRRLATIAREADDMLYLAMQLAAREEVATRTLDELLAEREALSGIVRAAIAARAEAIGLEVVSFGLKDIVLPGEMKSLLNRVTEAQKEAEANVILRREETAATRSLAQTAKLLAENPVLVRLKELEAYKDLAAKVGTVHLVVSNDGLPGLQIKAS